MKRMNLHQKKKKKREREREGHEHRIEVNDPQSFFLSDTYILCMLIFAMFTKNEKKKKNEKGNN